MPPPKYQLDVSRRAKSDLRAIHAYIARSHPGNASSFVVRLLDEMSRLCELPERHPEALESKLYKLMLRQVPVGAYRIIYRIKGRTVTVVTVRHASRLPFRK